MLYYPNGNKKSLTYNSGVREEYQYNKNNFLTNLKNINGAVILSEYKYIYDANSLLESKEDNKGKTSYTYDEMNRVKTINEPQKLISYTYDGSGNRKSETVIVNNEKLISDYTYDGTSRLKEVATKQGSTLLEAKSYIYDKNGNIKTETRRDINSNTNEVFNYEYDTLNNLITIKDANGKVIENNKYNGEGLRVQKTTEETDIKYIYEGNNPIIEMDAKSFVIAGKNEYVGNTILSRKTGGVKYNYLYNGHGDVVNLIDNKGTIKNT
ncbi:MAG: RHS repeat domain-containing protein, partial [Clostridium sp.]